MGKISMDKIFKLLKLINIWILYKTVNLEQKNKQMNKEEEDFTYYIQQKQINRPMEEISCQLKNRPTHIKMYNT